MIAIKPTEEADIPFITSCLEGKSEDFCSQCGYGSRFFKYPVTAEQISAFQRSRATDSFFFSIFNDDNIIGSLELITQKNDTDINKREICSLARFLIADKHRNNAYGENTLQLIKNFAFDKLYLTKITLGVFDFNSSALRCYEKAGFIKASRTTMENGWNRINMEVVKPI